MRTYRLDELCKVANVNAQTLRNWISGGLIFPVERGKTGTENSHRFSAIQVLAVAAGVRHQHEGSTPERAIGVMVYVAGLDEGAMEKAFDEGRTFPVPASIMERAASLEQSIVVLPGELIALPDSPSLTVTSRQLMKRLDLKTLWDEVRKKLSKFDTEAKGDPKANKAKPNAK
jgi:hypothetical protein